MDESRVKLIIENIEYLLKTLKEEILNENCDPIVEYKIDDYDEIFEG